MNANAMAEVVEKLAEKLGVAAEHLWGVLIRQAPISGITNMLVSVAWIVGAIWTFRFIKSKEKDPDCSEEAMVIGWAIWGVSAAVMFLVVGCALENNIAALVNPEYWALKQILP